MKKIIYISLLCCLFAACSDDPSINEVENEASGQNDIAGIYVAFGTRGDDWTIDKEYAESLAALGDTEGPNEEKPYIIDHFEEGDILYISQRGTTADPQLYNMQSNENNSNPAYTPQTVKANLYIYQYKKNSDGAQWTEGTNFVPYINQTNDSTPLNWKTIKNLGSVGNAFHFYALFQPKYPYRKANYGDIDYSQTPNFRTVTWMNYSGDESDHTPHSAYELGTRYGLFGAYHATSSLYTRMRFRMYPLFNLMQVTLLVPVQQNNSDDDPGYSGFGPNAFYNNWDAGNSSAQYYPGLWFGISYSAKNYFKNLGNTGIGTSFTINWNANISSDNDPPLIAAASGTTPVSFYLLRYDKDNPAAEHPAFEITNVKKYYPDSDRDTDMVRRYEFIAYYVPQSTFTNSDFNVLFSMMLLTPGSSGDRFKRGDNPSQQAWSVEGTYVPYYFYGNNKGQNQFTGGDYSDLGLNKQGMYQHITLYVPRKGNKTVMVSAKVIPWKETYTDMTIVERE